MTGFTDYIFKVISKMTELNEHIHYDSLVAIVINKYQVSDIKKIIDTVLELYNDKSIILIKESQNIICAPFFLGENVEKYKEFLKEDKTVLLDIDNYFISYCKYMDSKKEFEKNQKKLNKNLIFLKNDSFQNNDNINIIDDIDENSELYSIAGQPKILKNN